jgi:cytochrome c oxidase assembly protein subunit 15
MLLLFGIGLVLALQGAVGWIMVASGLRPGMTAVAPVKLTLHLTFASLFLAALVAVAARFSEGPGTTRRGTGRDWRSLVLVLLVFLQIALGGLVAGLGAGRTFNTWPLMDGQFVPAFDQLFAASPWIANFVDNAALVQFNHRLGAYALIAWAIHMFLASSRKARDSDSHRRLSWILGLILLQSALGIITLLLVVPIWAALLHQFAGMIVLIAAVRHAVLGGTMVPDGSRRQAKIAAVIF